MTRPPEQDPRVRKLNDVPFPERALREEASCIVPGALIPERQYAGTQNT